LTLWLKAFALTVCIEAGVGVPLLADADRRLWRRVAAVFFANLASHPAVWFVFPWLGRHRSTLWMSEAWAVTIEAALFVTMFPEAKKLRLAGVSLLINGCSWGIGRVLQLFSDVLG
jgi:hypothetical protein